MGFLIPLPQRTAPTDPPRPPIPRLHTFIPWVRPSKTCVGNRPKLTYSFPPSPSLPLAPTEYQIVDFFLGSKLKDEVMKIMPVQKVSAAGQITRFKAFVAVGDESGHVGLGVKCAKEVATAIRGAIIIAKMSVVPVRRGYWGRRNGLPHTVPNKVTGKCGSVRVRLIPAPRGTGLVAAPVPKKLLSMAGVEDCYTSSRGHTRTLGNFVKAVYFALAKTYGYLSPELWKPTVFQSAPYQEHTDFLAKNPAPKAAEF